MNINGGDLYRAPLNGGGPMLVEHNIMGADWATDGQQLVLVRHLTGRTFWKYPAGKVLFRTPDG